MRVPPRIQTADFLHTHNILLRLGTTRTAPAAMGLLRVGYVSSDVPGTATCWPYYSCHTVESNFACHPQ